MSDSILTEEDRSIYAEMYDIKRKILGQVSPDEQQGVKELEIALRAVESIENTIMRVRKLEQSEKRDEDLGDIAALAAAALARVNANKVGEIDEDRVAPTLPDSLDAAAVVDGELEFSNAGVDYKELYEDGEID